MSRIKQRGLKRKCLTMVGRIEAYTQAFPAIDESGYWHLPLPVAQQFIDSNTAPSKVRRLCIQTLIHRTHFLTSHPSRAENSRVLVSITLPTLWHSQIIVLDGSDYWLRFKERPQWVPLNTRLSKQWRISLPEGFSERVFAVQQEEDAHMPQHLVWLVGELEGL